MAYGCTEEEAVRKVKSIALQQSLKNIALLGLLDDRLRILRE